MKTISIIIPIYNEEKNIKNLFDSLTNLFIGMEVEYVFEFVFINDGSEDNSLEILESLDKSIGKIRIINFSRNFGQQNALKAGYDHCTGDAIICMDADLQNPPDMILQMISLWELGYDIVLCKRKDGNQNSGYLKGLFSRLFYKFLNILSEIRIEHNVPDFRLVDRKVLSELITLKEKDLFYRGIISWVGFKKVVIEYKHIPRDHGKTSYNLLKMMQLAASGITGFSLKPLYLSMLIGLLIILISFIYIFYALIIHYLGRTISGWTSIIVAIMFFGGIQLFFLGVIGVYVGKIFTQVKDRPNYIIKDHIY
ncbi:glycosyltransferase family 2 protein [Sphingobacterium hungaricum]|uniref:Glycosyltransferase n=1 Tax=Sphingobacterium hungaricum TaxID=2082723 RepID=A0A928UX14_9SPHI|nr:glycosyltransferase family 2 protein [Sphingobacterium hungaricum]MBE8714805.1 glycosyltransferase [Sphingobacterium hungaricum]